MFPEQCWTYRMKSLYKYDRVVGEERTLYAPTDTSSCRLPPIGDAGRLLAWAVSSPPPPDLSGTNEATAGRRGQASGYPFTDPGSERSAAAASLATKKPHKDPRRGQPIQTPETIHRKAHCTLTIFAEAAGKSEPTHNLQANHGAPLLRPPRRRRGVPLPRLSLGQEEQQQPEP